MGALTEYYANKSINCKCEEKELVETIEGRQWDSEVYKCKCCDKKTVLLKKADLKIMSCTCGGEIFASDYIGTQNGRDWDLKLYTCENCGTTKGKREPKLKSIKLTNIIFMIFSVFFIGCAEGEGRIHGDVNCQWISGDYEFFMESSPEEMKVVSEGTEDPYYINMSNIGSYQELDSVLDSYSPVCTKEAPVNACGRTAYNTITLTCAETISSREEFGP